MFKKIFEYAGPYKKNMYVATVVVLVSVLMGILPFVLAYQVISPLVMGDSVETEFVFIACYRGFDLSCFAGGFIWMGIINFS